jgi:hypothetical protein
LVVEAIAKRKAQVNGPVSGILDDCCDPAKRIGPERLEENAINAKKMLSPKFPGAPFIIASTRRQLQDAEAELNQRIADRELAHMNDLIHELFKDRIVEGNNAAKSDDPLYSLKKKINENIWFFPNMKAAKFHSANGRRYVLIQVKDDSRYETKSIPVEFAKMDVLVQKHPDGPIVGLKGERKSGMILEELQDTLLRVVSVIRALTATSRDRNQVDAVLEPVMDILREINSSDKRPTQDQARAIWPSLKPLVRDAKSSTTGSFKETVAKLRKILKYYSAVAERRNPG